MLFDVYFNLMGFFLGIITVLASEAAKKNGLNNLAVALSMGFAILYWAMLRFHLRGHSEANQWGAFRQNLPLLFFALAFVLHALTTR